LTSAAGGAKSEENMLMTDNGTAKNGDHCAVIAGTHKGKVGTVEDWKLSKSGHASITVRQADGVRFKTLARNVTPT
jgi:ribosomal protein S4E